MRHFYGRNNIGLTTARSNKNPEPDHFFITDKISETKFSESSTQSVSFPLYLFPEDGDLDQSVRVNFEPKLYARIRKAAGLAGPLVAPKGTAAFRSATGDARPDEVKVFDYIYGALYSPAYRSNFGMFLKEGYPRVPFPVDTEDFNRFSEQGEALRRLHLMEPEAIGDALFPFEGEGDSEVVKPRFEDGKVWINRDQYFDAVPEIAWEFPLAGYQPAQHWLKHRRGRTLSWQDVRHYQRLLKVLIETDRLMNVIDSAMDDDE